MEYDFALLTDAMVAPGVLAHMRRSSMLVESESLSNKETVLTHCLPSAAVQRTRSVLNLPPQPGKVEHTYLIGRFDGARVMRCLAVTSRKRRYFVRQLRMGSMEALRIRGVGPGHTYWLARSGVLGHSPHQPSALSKVLSLDRQTRRPPDSELRALRRIVPGRRAALIYYARSTMGHLLKQIVTEGMKLSLLNALVLTAKGPELRSVVAYHSAAIALKARTNMIAAIKALVASKPSLSRALDQARILKGKPEHVLLAIPLPGQTVSTLLALVYRDVGLPPRLRPLPGAAHRSPPSPPNTQPPVPKYSRATAVGALSAHEIRAVIRGRLQDIKYCYMRFGLSTNPTLAGSVKVEVWVQPTGRVSKVSIRETTMRHPSMEKCIRDAILRWRFPAAAQGGSRVIYPFHFRPKRRADDAH
jgi:TonB family protein